MKQDCIKFSLLKNETSSLFLMIKFTNIFWF